MIIDSLELLLCSTFVICVLALSCSDGPVSFDSADFTIRGPCPANDTVLAPVGTTVQYRCDYEDRRTGTDLPYWYIPGLSAGIPFLEGEGTEHNLTITTVTGATGHTIVSIPVKEQYLNYTLTIQCGICSIVACVNAPLSENITSSSSVKLVTFGTPRDPLNSNDDDDTVTLSWSPPVVSVGYNCSVYECFQYEVQLTNELNSSQQIVFPIIEDTRFNVSRLDISERGFDTCSNYSWSVSALVDEYRSQPANGTESLLLQPGPSSVTTSFTASLNKCSSNGSEISSVFTTEVISCESGLSIKTIAVFKPFNEETIPLTITAVNYALNGTYVIDSVLSLPYGIEFSEGMFVVNISDSYGIATTMLNINDTVDNFTCSSNVSPTSTSISSTQLLTHQISSLMSVPPGIVSTETLYTQVIKHPSVTTIAEADSNTGVIVGATIGCFIGLCIIIILAIISFTAVLHLRKKIGSSKQQPDDVDKMKRNEAYSAVEVTGRTEGVNALYEPVGDVSYNSSSLAAVKISANVCYATTGDLN